MIVGCGRALISFGASDCRRSKRHVFGGKSAVLRSPEKKIKSSKGYKEIKLTISSLFPKIFDT